MKLTEQERTVLDQDYAQGEVVRSKAARFSLIQRGSVRLIRDLYRTESEQRAFIDAGLRVKLPGQE
jgi:hypothetical protein